MFATIFRLNQKTADRQPPSLIPRHGPEVTSALKLRSISIEGDPRVILSLVSEVDSRHHRVQPLLPWPGE